MGSADPLENGRKIKKRKHAKKEQFSILMVYFESNQGRQVYMLTAYLFRYTLQNAPFRSQIFTIFFVSGGKGALTP